MTSSNGPFIQDPLFSMARGDIAGVLAMVIRTEGPSYRAVGAAMVFDADGGRIGSLSSGCIEADLAIHAETVRNSGTPQRIIYGRGSPFVDIQLPCGGGLEILLIPQPGTDELGLIRDVETDREAQSIAIALETGTITPCTQTQTGLSDTTFHLQIDPPLHFVVFGKGPEAGTFVHLVQTLGHGGTLVSPDPETLAMGNLQGWDTRTIRHPHGPADLTLDTRTAVVLFFHDHEWEAPILKDILGAEVLYVGAQGSMRARDTRLLELEALGVSDDARAKVRGPIGVIPSVRDSKTLAVSVLAEILSLM